MDGSDRSHAVAGRSDAVEGRAVNMTEHKWSAEIVEYNVASGYDPSQNYREHTRL